MIRTKADVETHREGYGYHQYPAVNVKVYAGWDSVPLPIHLGSSYPTGHPELQRDHYTAKGFTHDWLRQWADDNLDLANAYWNSAAELGFEMAEDEAKEIFADYKVKVYSEGRSGGWLIVEGLPDIESCDAVLLAKWRRFAKYARTTADNVPYDAVVSVYLNVYEPAHMSDDTLHLIEQGAGL